MIIRRAWKLRSASRLLKPAKPIVGKIGSPERVAFDLALKTDLKKGKTKSWSEIKNNVYGEKGTERRDELEGEVETLKIGLLRGQARESLNMTQEDLAKVIDKKELISHE